MNNNVLKWIWLSLRCGADCGEFLTLAEAFGDADSIYCAEHNDYLNAGISERLCSLLDDKRLERECRILEYCQTWSIDIVSYDSEKYPSSLKSLSRPPILLYVYGKLPDMNRRLCISIVGTRRMSDYGMRATYKIAYEIASSGAVVVSGMALGIDGIASCGAIASGGTTVAVLGCGIDRSYPAEHAKLKEIIRQHGAVITEFPPATEPKGYNFPIRNRIISGLSQGTVVIDADENSGAMITAKSAILQGRDIYAVPGNIDDFSASGTNLLIRDGAAAVLCGRDVIKNYAYIYRDRLDMQRLAAAEQRSEFNPEMVRNMGVSVRSGSAQKKGEGSSKSRMNPDFAKPDMANKPLTGKKNGKDAEKKDKPAATNNCGGDIARIDDGRAQVGSSDKSEREKSRGDNSRQIFETLNEKQRKIYGEIPDDRAITVDFLIKLGYNMGEVMSTLTVLEIKGLIASLPGALYIRK